MHLPSPVAFNTNLLEWHLRLAQKTPHPKTEDPIQQIIQESLDATCIIYIHSAQEVWTGSGFHIGSGLVVTASHVVPPNLAETAHDIQLSFDNKILLPAQIVVSDGNYDCALLRVDRMPSAVPIVPMGDSDTVKNGDIIAVIASPEGWANTSTVGRVTNIHQSMGANAPSPAWQEMFFIDADILQGASGGLVIGTDGLAIGLVMGVTGQHAELGIGEHAVAPINKVKLLLQSISRGG